MTQLADGAGPSVWLSAPQRPAQVQRKDRFLPEGRGHPGKNVAVDRCQAIASYTCCPGGLVVDPMCSIGTSLVEAIHQDRDAIGIEYAPEWVHLARGNLDYAADLGATDKGHVLGGDARHLPSLLTAEPATTGRQAALC